ncbi:OmpA family protein [Amylibacter sp.]|nr:OmpA family protein [Amylibacter sp.]
MDSSEVRYSLEDSLVRLSTSLNKYPNTNVEIIGHTDNVGEENYNQKLSARRAESVSSILAQNDVSRSRIKAYGRGEIEPAMSNNTSKGRASNRRVEIIITPLVDQNAKLPNVGLNLSVRL